MEKINNKWIKTPFGRFGFIWTKDKGEAQLFSNRRFLTNLTAIHKNAKGDILGVRDLGSGLITNCGVNQLAHDYTWAANSQTLKLQNNHASGTGTTAAAVGDVALQTANGTTATAGTQSVVEPNIYKTLATIAYTATLAITEWGLVLATTLSGASGSTGTSTATGATTLTDTGQAWATNTWAGYTVTTGTVMSLILSNTATVLTLALWVTPSTNVTASTPATGAYVIRPTMLDHRVFSAINVNTGDSIQFNYQSTQNSGG